MRVFNTHMFDENKNCKTIYVRDHRCIARYSPYNAVRRRDVVMSSTRNKFLTWTLPRRRVSGMFKRQISIYEELYDVIYINFKENVCLNVHRRNWCRIERADYVSGVFYALTKLRFHIFAVTLDTSHVSRIIENSKRKFA